MPGCPCGLSADEILGEIHRLYQEFKALGGMQDHPPAATHDQQSVLIAQIQAWGERLKVVQKDTHDHPRVPHRGDPIDRISAKSATR